MASDLQKAFELYQAGHVGEAAMACERFLKSNPRHADALHLRGVLALQANDTPGAVRFLTASVTIRPRADILQTLGQVLQSSGNPAEAATRLHQAVALDPKLAVAHYFLGLSLVALGDIRGALDSYQRAVAAKPDFAEALTNLALLQSQCGLGVDAAENLLRANEVMPRHPLILTNLGSILMGLGRNEDAVIALDAALAASPGHAEALVNRSKAMGNLGRWQEAEADARQAVAHAPAMPQAYNNLGHALHSLGRLDEAEAAFRQGLALGPSPSAWNNLARLLQEKGNPDEALRCCDQALALSPGMPEARSNRALANLALGNLRDGWRDFEARWLSGLAPAHTELPRWAGEDLAGRAILLHAEQGLGDTLQFCRYAPLVAARGARVVLEVQAPLVRLLARSMPEVTVIAQGAPLPFPAELQCPLMSLPLAFDTTLETIPAEPYLSADPGGVERWRARLPADGLRVGLVWAGNPRADLPEAHLIDRRRSLAAELLAPLAGLPSLCFVSLQKDARPPLPPLEMLDFTAELKDFEDTAGLVAGLDLVVTVDTSVAHLAGGLGKPVWILSRFDSCWRWLRDRDDSPWYPTARLFRQPAPGDWASVVARLVTDLSSLS